MRVVFGAQAQTSKELIWLLFRKSGISVDKTEEHKNRDTSNKRTK